MITTWFQRTLDPFDACSLSLSAPLLTPDSLPLAPPSPPPPPAVRMPTFHLDALHLSFHIYANHRFLIMTPLSRSFSLPTSLSNSVSRLKVFSGNASKDEVS